MGSPSTSTWYFIVLEHDSTDNELRIQVTDGAVDSVSFSGGPAASTSDFTIGATSHATTKIPYDGLVDSVFFWKTILSTRQKTFLYNQGVGRDIRAKTTDNKVTATWNVLPIVDSTDMKLRARVNRVTSVLESSWNETDAVFTLQNGPC